MVKKGLSLPQSHRQAIRDGLNRYYSMNDMSQERKDNISKGQKARLAKRDSSQIKAHKEAISKGTRKYYEIILDLGTEYHIQKLHVKRYLDQ